MWLCSLDLALLLGWRPKGTTHPDELLERSAATEMRWEPAAYFLARGQLIQGIDARELGRCLELALAQVQDDEIPLSDGAFGRLNTLHSLQLAMGGDTVPGRNSEVAFQLLSGTEKQAAVELSSFLLRGTAMRVMPDASLAG